MRKSDIPNTISALRVLLIFPIVWLLFKHEYQLALGLFALAGASDALDGYLARKYDWKSHLGGWLDPLADKAMQISVYVSLAWLGLIPAWLLFAVRGRDLIIIAGGLIYYYKFEKIDASPSLLSKLNTLLQILLVLIILVHHSLYAFPANFVDGFIYLVFGVTILSGLSYVLTWGIRAIQLRQGNHD